MEQENIAADDKFRNSDELVQLARLALSGRRQDIQMYIRRLSRKLKGSFPKASDQLVDLLRELPSIDSPIRGEGAVAIPVDTDSRLQLVRVEHPVVLESNPIWAPVVKERLDQVVSERTHDRQLSTAGLVPTKSIIFTGLPGVGKTLAARWIAQQLKRPLLVLDLSAVMSSFLGRTGANLRYVLDYAKSMDSILLMDEFDAIAKRRDDAVEVGELKRLVTVLLQEIDDWPPTGILIAATNHPTLLDPAVWRRFEMVIEFPMPTADQIQQSIGNLLRGAAHEGNWDTALTTVLQGLSFSDIQREVNRIRRESIIFGKPLDQSISRLVSERVANLSRSGRIKLAAQLCEAGLSQRQSHEITGVSRDTIRKGLK